ncbi:MAG: hypothetical protein ABI476_01600 [Oxalobacteraceae bacterium]
MSVALAEDGSLADLNVTDVNAMADTASMSGATQPATKIDAAASVAGCALPALAETLAISQYVAVCSTDNTTPLPIVSAAHPALPADQLPTDDPATVVADRMVIARYDDKQREQREQREKMFLILLEDETEPPLPQYDGLRSTNAILLKQETREREPAELAQAPSYDLDEAPAIDLQSAIVQAPVTASNKAENEVVIEAVNEVGNREPPQDSSADNQALAMTAVLPENDVQPAVTGAQIENALSLIALSTASAAAENSTHESAVSASAFKIAPAEPPPTAVDTRPAPPVATHDAKDQWLAAVTVSDTDLDQMRGGFDTGSGLLVSFGIQRAVYINGNLVTTTSFHIPDVSKVTSAQAAMLGSAAGTVNVVQNGPGNTIQSGALSQAVAGTVIQNSLNNQHIQNLTIIDTTTNSLGMLKSLNSQSALKDALSNSLLAK